MNTPQAPVELIDDDATVIASIQSGQYDESLGGIISAAKDRKERLALVQGHQLTIGQKVVFCSGRPHYIVGEKATVVKVMQKYVTVRMDRAIGRFNTASTVRAPMSMIRAI